MSKFVHAVCGETLFVGTIYYWLNTVFLLFLEQLNVLLLSTFNIPKSRTDVAL